MGRTVFPGLSRFYRTIHFVDVQPFFHRAVCVPGVFVSELVGTPPVALGALAACGSAVIVLHQLADNGVLLLLGIYPSGVVVDDSWRRDTRMAPAFQAHAAGLLALLVFDNWDWHLARLLFPVSEYQLPICDSG